jgi:glutamate 5-kinase
MATVIASGYATDALVRAVLGQETGTFFEPWGARPSADRRRSLGRAFVKGALVIDAGAVTALRGGRSSLLAVGVREVRGTFQMGDVVEVLGPDMALVARGTVAYPSQAVERVKGLRSAQARELLTDGDDSFAGDEVVHLDNLVLL